jgi:hypothetical protein
MQDQRLESMEHVMSLGIQVDIDSDRTLCLNCEGMNSMMKILDESLRIRINSNWFCTIIAELSSVLMKLIRIWWILKFWKRLGFLLWMFLKVFLGILVFDLWWSERELETCYWWVLLSWPAPNGSVMIGPLYRWHVLYLGQ